MITDTSTDDSALWVQVPGNNNLDSIIPDLVAENEVLPAFKLAEAYQIVSIGTSDDKYAFKYHEDKLQAILSKIPSDTKVAVVSVVGAFRTGKSFLLSWFLRYLEHLTNQPNVEKSTDDIWYNQFQSLGNDGFEWKGGSERNTTGVWMWSHPYILPRKDGRGPIAVLLVDTQGMFDNETTMAVTASIFGISTLLSSYQIYNVDKRIQEDNLQQLALFSEYARMAMGSDEQESEPKSSEVKAVDATHQEGKEKETSLKRFDEIIISPSKRKPFQLIEFLVRDWQHFDEEHDDVEAMEKSMSEYLEKVIAEREARDLKETREQILSCFENITCSALCHPGLEVPKNKFNGDVKKIEKLFLQLLDRLCNKIFDPELLEPKVIHDRELTGDQLAVYIKAYAGLFAAGGKFPTAATMLDATASANNTNAVRMAVQTYKEEMSKLTGPSVSDYLPRAQLEKEHTRSFSRSLQIFDSVANFGSKRSIAEARELFLREVRSDFDIYQSLNESRNPLAGWETYGIPFVVACMSAFLRWLTDAVCSAHVCKTTSSFLSHTHATGWFFLAIIAATKFKQIKDLSLRTKDAVQLMMNQGKAKKD